VPVVSAPPLPLEELAAPLLLEQPSARAAASVAAEALVIRK
jgi:hypothetical protein